jgi:hypothetical protein
MAKDPLKFRTRTTTDVTAEVVMVTPAIASDWLKLRRVNRPISTGTVAGYARDMKAGNWTITGASICFNVDDELVDGQHRLEACIQSRVNFLTIVVRGLPRGAERLMDCGRMRSLADELAFEGVQAAVRTAAAARWLYRIKHRNAHCKERVTRAELLSLINEHPKLERSGLAVHKILAVRPALLAAMHYIGYEILGEQQAADDFISVFADSKSFYTDDAALFYREAMIKKRFANVKVTSKEMLNGTIWAWNRFVNRESAVRLAIPENQTIIGLDLDKL